MEEKHLKINIAQYALIISNKKMLVLWPPNHDPSPLWLLPGGRLNNSDESYEKALSREVEEEIGLDISIEKPYYVDMYKVPKREDRYAVFFLCSLKEDKANIKLSHEHSKFEWLSYQELMSVLQKHLERARPGIILLEKLRRENLL